MAKILALFCVAALVAVSHGEVDRDFFQARVAKLEIAFPAAKCADKKLGERVCDSCTSFKVCLIDGEMTESQKCPQEQPNCVDGKCSKEPNPEKSCNVDLQCSGEGYFPNPSNCSQFFYCDGGKATHYDCPRNYVADPPNLLCKPKRSASDCKLITCKADQLYATYPPNRSYFALCVNGKPIVDKCDDENEQFDEKLYSCNFVCPREGLFPVHDSPNKYRACYKINNKDYVWTEDLCPDGLDFDSNELKCVKAEDHDEKNNLGTDPAKGSSEEQDK